MSSIEEENRRLREEVRRLTMERDILKKKGCQLLREGTEVRYLFVDDHREQWPVSVLCRVLQVSRSGFYAWCSHDGCITALRRAELTERIAEIHRESRRTYGSPRIHAELVAQGHRGNRKTVAKYMRNAGIQAKLYRKFRVTTTDSNHAHPVARNIVNRDFQPQGKNQTSVTDITYVATKEG